MLVIGSGPIIIGQAAEFDYAGTQACKSLREEGVTTVLVNSNPATIMTDEGIADRVYIEPLTVEVLDALIGHDAADWDGKLFASFVSQLLNSLYSRGLIDLPGVLPTV